MAKINVTARAKTSVSDRRPDEQLTPVELNFITQSNYGTWEGYFEPYEEGKRWEDIYPQYACGVRVDFVVNNMSYQYASRFGKVQGLPSEYIEPKDIYIMPGTDNENLCKR